ncbi:uncharacterized protein LOC125035788 [Penaeus chinensis]|uniref:uncharacterized protein LOC125035788 n=1 Tax=Penaeus chinensis TaxID=139456 RepID=UPI001FB6BFBC|nr:uncharacterized protein LOC125035788 [Penaeus chinensis]
MRLADRLHAPAFVYSLVIFHLSKVAENKEEKENQRRWNHNSLPVMLEVTGSRDKAENSNGEDGWNLDEEAVASTTGEAVTRSDKASIRSSEHWWQITSSYDPALDAEPALWDGERLVDSESPNIFDEYLLIQDTWEEHKVS